MGSLMSSCWDHQIKKNFLEQWGQACERPDLKIKIDSPLWLIYYVSLTGSSSEIGKWQSSPPFLSLCWLIEEFVSRAYSQGHWQCPVLLCILSYWDVNKDMDLPHWLLQATIVSQENHLLLVFNLYSEAICSFSNHFHKNPDSFMKMMWDIYQAPRGPQNKFLMFFYSTDAFS